MTVFYDNRPIQVPTVSLRGNLITEIKEQGRSGPRYVNTTDYDQDAPNRIRNLGVVAVTGYTANITYQRSDLLIFKDYVKIKMEATGVKMMPYERQMKKFDVNNDMVCLGRLEETHRNMGEIRYTLNGKDPSRTKYRVYAGSFKLRPGTISADKIVLKARTYQDGRWSDVTAVDIKIVDDAFLDGMTGSTTVYS